MTTKRNKTTKPQATKGSRLFKRVVAGWFACTFAVGYGWGLYTFWPLVA